MPRENQIYSHHWSIYEHFQKCMNSRRRLTFQCNAGRSVPISQCSFLRSHVHSAFHSQSTTTLAMTSYKFMAINQWWALKLLTGHHSGRHTTFARSFISIVDSIPLLYNSIYKGIYPRTILFFVSPSMHFLAIANTTQKNHNKTEHSG